MKKFLNYLIGVRQEFAKVVFPPRQTVLTQTGLVVATIVISVIVIGLVDFGLAQIVRITLVRQ